MIGQRAPAPRLASGPDGLLVTDEVEQRVANDLDARTPSHLAEDHRAAAVDHERRDLTAVVDAALAAGRAAESSSEGIDRGGLEILSVVGGIRDPDKQLLVELPGIA